MGYDTIHGAKKAAECPECGSSGADNWEKTTTLPNVGGVYECGECGTQAYLYDAGPNLSENNIVWRPMRTVIWMDGQFEKIVDEPPRPVIAEYVNAGLSRTVAIDWWIVEQEGLSQSEWADRTDRSQATVSEHVSKANAQLPRA